MDSSFVASNLDWISGPVVSPLPLTRCVAADRGFPPVSGETVIYFPSSDAKNLDASP